MNPTPNDTALIARLNDELMVKRALAAMLDAGRIDLVDWRGAVRALKARVLS